MIKECSYQQVFGFRKCCQITFSSCYPDNCKLQNKIEQEKQEDRE